MQTTSIEGIGEIQIRKSRRAKRLILRINHEGRPVVTIPAYLPYSVGVRYARSHQNWVLEHSSTESIDIFVPGARFGKHYLEFKPADRNTTSSRVTDERIIVSYPQTLTINDQEVQNAAKRAVTRAIKRQAEDILPHMLYQLAEQYGYSYSTVTVKNMRSRWGSCSSQGAIVLNIWLIQLPERLQRYVLCHELTHLHNPNHQAAFWRELTQMIPDYKQLRKELKAYQPSISFTQ